jgi:hypothetical protein
MKTILRLSLLVLAPALIGQVLADDDSPTPTDRARALQRDQQMVQALIASGLQLAAEKDPLRRADQCNRLADHYAVEIKQAVKNKDAVRAAQFGQQMQALLTRGVAQNLAVARAAPKPDETEIHRLGAWVSITAKGIEEELGHHPELEPDQMQFTLQAVAQGKADVEQAVRGKQ